ncbi:MAG: glycosyltransferase, partial [Leptolyngbyaceae bacterium]|nr:glycosyltransferase [Leptolyngbyaceae bacterium]
VYFSAADIVVLPFRSVSTSGSLLLAMSYGKPVIAPKIGGIASTLAEADDLLYDPDDDLGLLHALNAGMEINDVEMGKRVNQVCDRLSWASIAQQTSQLYIKALDSGKNAPQG